jgi:hypothetical protein
VQNPEEQLKSPRSLLLQGKVTWQCREMKQGPAFAAETEDEQDARHSSVMANSYYYSQYQGRKLLTTHHLSTQNKEYRGRRFLCRRTSLDSSGRTLLTVTAAPFIAQYV